MAPISVQNGNQWIDPIRLMHIGVAVWVASLLLPGFRIDPPYDAVLGIVILVTGVLFGWMVNGWAAYANLCFLFVAVQVYRGKPAPLATALMLLLPLTIYFFEGVITEEGSMMAQPVASWGWGAIVWGCALVFAGMASAVQSRSLAPLGVKVIVVLVCLALLTAGAVHFFQRQRANLQERVLYLSRGMAITIVPFCNVPFDWPQGAVVPAGEIIRLEIDRSLRYGSAKPPYLQLPELPNVQEGEFSWRTYEFGSNDRVRVRSAAQPTRYVMQAHRTMGGAIIRLLDTQSNAALYEQKLRIRSRTQRRAEFCPLAQTHVQDARYVPGTEMGYREAILRAVRGHAPAGSVAGSLHRESARVPCNVGDVDIDGIRGLRYWDGREVVVPESVRSRAGFCSDSYVGLVYLSAAGNAKASDLRPVVHLFDRQSLRPLALFNSRGPCPDTGCRKAPKSIIKGFRVEGDSMSVETELGEAQAQRVPL